MSNLYEILEVSEKASKEVIDKAYHVLAKKYHPDLQNGNAKKIAEEKMKKINEAYEILGDTEKRKQYDEELKIKREEQKRIEEIKRIQQEQNIKNAKINEINNIQRLKQEEIQRNMQEQENSNMKILQNEMKRAYSQAYNDYLRSKEYKIKEPWTLKRFIELLKVIAILAIIITVIWFFPPTHKLIIDFYEGNEIAKTIVDLLGKIFEGIGNAIVQFFQNTF